MTSLYLSWLSNLTFYLISTKSSNGKEILESSTFLVSNCASSWQHPLQSGSSCRRLNCPSKSQELQSKLLEKPNSLQDSEENSAPNAETWKQKMRGGKASLHYKASKKNKLELSKSNTHTRVSETPHLETVLKLFLNSVTLQVFGSSQFFFFS